MGVGSALVKFNMDMPTTTMAVKETCFKPGNILLGRSDFKLRAFSVTRFDLVRARHSLTSDRQQMRLLKIRAGHVTLL